MPTGIPIKYIKCRKCPGSKFKTVSALRTHQWAEHRKMFDKLKNSTKTVKTARDALSVREFKQAPPAVPLAPNGDMRVSELLGELKGQQKFITDVVNLVEHLAMKRQGAQ